MVAAVCHGLCSLSAVTWKWQQINHKHTHFILLHVQGSLEACLKVYMGLSWYDAVHWEAGVSLHQLYKSA